LQKKKPSDAGARKEDTDGIKTKDVVTREVKTGEERGQRGVKKKKPPHIRIRESACKTSKDGWGTSVCEKEALVEMKHRESTSQPLTSENRNVT